MYYCPSCNVQLNRNSSPLGIIWSCPKCMGNAFTISILRKTVPAHIVKDFWLKIKSQKYPEKRICPACKFAMSEIPIKQGNNSVYVDACKKCNLIWFDANEVESLPKIEISKEKIKEVSKTKEEIAKLQQEIIFEMQREADIEHQRDIEEKIYLIINIALRLLFRF